MGARTDGVLCAAGVAGSWRGPGASGPLAVLSSHLDASGTAPMRYLDMLPLYCCSPPPSTPLPCPGAETIYSLEAMASLYRCIKACLRPGAGVALVAAKSYYFGVVRGDAASRRGRAGASAGLQESRPRRWGVRPGSTLHRLAPTRRAAARRPLLGWSRRTAPTSAALWRWLTTASRTSGRF